MNRLNKIISAMSKKEAIAWYKKQCPNTKLARKTTIYREILRKAQKSG